MDRQLQELRRRVRQGDGSALRALLAAEQRCDPLLRTVRWRVSLSDGADRYKGRGEHGVAKLTREGCIWTWCGKRIFERHLKRITVNTLRTYEDHAPTCTACKGSPNWQTIRDNLVRPRGQPKPRSTSPSAMKRRITRAIARAAELTGASVAHINEYLEEVGQAPEDILRAIEEYIDDSLEADDDPD